MIDLTTVTGGLEQRRLNDCLKFQSDLNAEGLTVLAPTGSVSVPEGATLITIDGNPGEKWARLESEIRELSDKSGDEISMVISYQTSVEDLIAASDDLRKNLKFINMRDAVRPGQSSTSWPETEYPLADAIKILQRVIRKSGGSIRTTQVRPAITREDSRFKKNLNDPSPLAQQNIVALLLRSAEAQGVISRDGDSSNPTVTLTTTDPLTRGVVTSKEFERESDRYIDLLRDAGLGPFQQVRWAVYDAIEAEIETRGKRSVEGLLDASVAKVRSDVESASSEGRDYLVGHTKKNLPWSQVRGFVGVLMTRVPVLLDTNGNPLRADWLSLRSEVGGISADWRLALDSQLVMYLIENGCSISHYTEVELSGALYNTRLNLDLVHDLLFYLLNSGKCVLSEDHTELRKAD